MSNFERCYYMCGDKPLQMVTCLAGDWDQDVDSDPHRFACPIRWVWNQWRRFLAKIFNDSFEKE